MRPEILATDVTPWEVGPFHPMLPGPMRLSLKLDGEVVTACDYETGFLYKGLETTLAAHSWHAAVAYADHVDPEGAVFGELALCLAVEEVAGIEVSARDQSIRIIVSELARISAHLSHLVRLAKVTGSAAVTHYLRRDRERILDLFELLTGARFSLNYMRIGGVAQDVTDGFAERVNEVCDALRIRLKEYNDVFSFNQALVKRTALVGVLLPDTIQKFSVSGPAARASGVSRDVRLSQPYSGYSGVQLDAPVGRGETGVLGDSHDRLLVRMREIAESLKILKQVIERMPAPTTASAKIGPDFKVAPGEAFSRVESSRGQMGCHVVSDGSVKPVSVTFAPPSMALLQALPEVAIGLRLQDLPVAIASLDISVSEVDR